MSRDQSDVEFPDDYNTRKKNKEIAYSKYKSRNLEVNADIDADIGHIAASNQDTDRKTIISTYENE